MDELIKLWQDRLEMFKQKPEVAKSMDAGVAMGVHHSRVKTLETCIRELQAVSIQTNSGI